MVIFNGKEMNFKYMAEDEVVVEIRSLLTPEELLEKLRAGEDIGEVATVAAYKTKNGKFVTYADDAGILDSARFGYQYSFDGNEGRVDMGDRIEEYVDTLRERPQVFVAFEKFNFNLPMKGYNFENYAIPNEELKKHLFSSLGIMPTLWQESDLSVQELKALSGAGDKLYWDFGKVAKDNHLPNRSDIEFYNKLGTYEKKLINESTVHPAKLLDIAKLKKAEFSGALLTKADEEGARIIKDAAHVAYGSLTPSLLGDSIHWNIKNLKEGRIERYYRETGKQKEQIAAPNIDGPLKVVADALFEAKVFTEDELSSGKVGKERYEALLEDYKKANTLEDGSVDFSEDKIKKFVNKNYRIPLSSTMAYAEAKFKENFSGRAPMVLSEYMFGILASKGYRVTSPQELRNIPTTKIDKIVKSFNQKNIQKIAQYRNPVLFALSTVLNFNDVKDEHIELLGVSINTNDLETLFDKKFPEWYAAHKNTNNSELTELLSMLPKISKFDVNKDAKDLITDVTQAKGKAECKYMQDRYHYDFKNNELAIRGRHVMVQDGKMKMYMLPADDYRNFTVGYDTHCCQHYGGAGETCVYKLTTDPFAGVVVIERNGEILAQGFVWTDESKDTLVFDNVEFANDRDVASFSDLFAAWSREMPYKNIHVGTGYNQGMRGWGDAFAKGQSCVKLPTTLSDHHCYSDYHSDARIIKKDGNVLVNQTKALKVSKSPDEPTRWDALAQPAAAFMLNDFHCSIEERMALAQAFLENPDLRVQMDIVKRNPEAIEFIENPADEVQEYVVKIDKKYAALIKNPCQGVQELIIESNPSRIKDIDNPAENLVVKALSCNGLLLQYIKQPTEAAIRAALEQNGYAIRFVPPALQTQAVQTMAIRTSPKVVSLLRNPSEESKLLAVSLDPHVISLMRDTTPEVERAAVSRDAAVINEIKDPAYETVRFAVERNGLMIRNFQYQYPQLREVALRQSGYAIRALSNPTREEYMLAVRTTPAVINTIRDPQIKAEIAALVSVPDTNVQRPQRDNEEISFE